MAIKLTSLKTNPGNPRIIKDEKFGKLCNSIREFPKMMELLPIVTDDAGVILGGNMRLAALKELNYKEIPNSWVKKASELTEEEKKRFIIADNVGFGEWDWGILASDWDIKQLSDWGMDIPDFENPATKEHKAQDVEFKFFLVKCPVEKSEEVLKHLNKLDCIEITESNG